MKHYKTISELLQDSGYPMPENPMLSLLTFAELSKCSVGENKFTTDFYVIALKKIKSGKFLYGKTKYDHNNGSMTFMKPRQIMEISKVEVAEKTFLIFIHEEYLLGHNLHSEIKKYGFFDYETNEALHLSPSEEQVIWDVYDKISVEYKNNLDEFSKEIMLTHIDSILKYAQRFYKRQFLNRTISSGKIITRFTEVMDWYMENGELQKRGLPTVKYLASKLMVSPRYLSDLLKQETDRTALEHIHAHLVMEAKNRLMSSDKTVTETAYELGFENPPYFFRLFKKEVGLTPTEYRKRFVN
jgi:AraC-like DNA-binding protein